MRVNKDWMKIAGKMAAIGLWALLVVLAAGWCGSAPAQEDASAPADEGNAGTGIPGMTIQEAILLALRNNRTIESAYLDRVAQKFDLKVAEDEFIPNLDLTGSINRNDTTVENVSRTGSVNDTGATGITLSEALPTGGTLSFRWEMAADR